MLISDWSSDVCSSDLVTIFWPLHSFLAQAIGWRMTFAVCAGMQLFVCLPLYLFGLPRPIARKAGDETDGQAPVALTASERRLAFLLIAATTTIGSFVTFGLAPTLLELLERSGASAEFALQLAAARGGIGISARPLDMALGRRDRTR